MLWEFKLDSSQPLNKIFCKHLRSRCCISSDSTLFVNIKKIFRQNKTCTVFLENYNLAPLDMYRISKVNCIKAEGRIHSIYSMQRVNIIETIQTLYNMYSLTLTAGVTGVYLTFILCGLLPLEILHLQSSCQ